MKRAFLAFVTALLLFSIHLMYAENGKFSGYLFGDYYYFAKNHNASLEKSNGFWIRRIYFTYDQTLSEAFSVRLRFEMAHPGNFSSANAVPFIKDAYLKYKTGGHQILLGISPTPTWEVIEKVWGYRSVEKTPLDLQKFGSSRDFGLALKGNLTQDGKFKYHLMVGNGSGTKSESNQGKKAMLSVGFYPSEGLMVEIYGDYDNRPGKTDRITAQGFVAYRTDAFRVGVHFAHQIRKQENQEDLKLNIASVFAVARVSEKTNFFARVDRLLDPNPDGAKISYLPFDNTAKATFFVGGLDFAPHAKVHLMPNVELVLYNENEAGVKPDTDVVPRFTFFYKF